MACIDHEKKLVFIHNPKTGGTSIAQTLGSRDYNIRNHASLRKISKIDPKTEPYFKFCFVRNPWDRLWSLYCYYVERSVKYDSFLVDLDFNSWVLEGCLTFFNGYLGYSQLDWMINEQGDIGVDFIGRFERLEKDFTYLANKFGYNSNLPHRRVKRETKPYQEVYNDKAVDYVRLNFSRDIEMFGYKF